MATQTTTLAPQNGSIRPSSLPACEACRGLKMRCIRPDPMVSLHGVAQPCERCARSSKHCSIPNPRALGRRRGATGRYRGIEKAFRQVELELRRAHKRLDGGAPLNKLPAIKKCEEILHQLRHDSLIPQDSHSPIWNPDDPYTSVATLGPPTTSPSAESGSITEASSHPNPQSLQIPAARGHGTISNPLGLLADAAGAAHARNQSSLSSKMTLSANESPTCRYRAAFPNRTPRLGQSLLNHSACVPLCLSLPSEDLENGLDALFTPLVQCDQSCNYFNPPEAPSVRDTGPEFDPVDLGLVSLDEACALFPIYFIRLHPINGILDPGLHTVSFVRSRSALLFTWILALTAQFEPDHGALAKRLRLHGEKLSKHVHTCGFKSVEIVQGYYISLLSATPASSITEERTSLYTTHALGLAMDLGLNQKSGDRFQQSGSTTFSFPTPERSLIPEASPATHSRMSKWEEVDNCHAEDFVTMQRFARNRERAWFRIFLWERANSAARGLLSPFPETELTLGVETWWLHPLAIPADKFTCAFILLRRHLALLYYEIIRQRGILQSRRHWAQELVNDVLRPWCQTWLPSLGLDASKEAGEISADYLRYVYMHGRLWILTFALHGSPNGNPDTDAIKEDCFEAAVKCCEVAVRDLQEIGQPLFCMLTTTWSMISYAAVLALKLFPSVHGSQVGSEIQLVALLAQTALQLERAGTTPPHRCGIAALLGRHLLVILRARAATIAETLKFSTAEDVHLDSITDVPSLNNGAPENSVPHNEDPFCSMFDPFLTTSVMSGEQELMEESFADILRDLFGQGFGGMTQSNF